MNKTTGGVDSKWIQSRACWMLALRVSPTLVLLLMEENPQQVDMMVNIPLYIYRVSYMLGG